MSYIVILMSFTAIFCFAAIYLYFYILYDISPMPCNDLWD